MSGKKDLTRRYFLENTAKGIAGLFLGAGMAGAAVTNTPLISCIPICFFREIITTKEMLLTEWIDMAAEIGLDGIEMYKPFLQDNTREYLENLSNYIQKSGLKVSMFTSYHELATPLESDRIKQIESLQQDVETAVVFRTNIVRVTAGAWPQNYSHEQSLSNIAECLRRSLDYAEKKGVMLALEDHPDIGTSTADFTSILSRVADDRLKVNLDTSNTMVSGETAVRLTEIVKDRVIHVHASDRNQQLEHQVVGEGVVPFADIFRILKSVNFKGWISLEAGGTKRQQGIAAGMNYVRRTWESI